MDRKTDRPGDTARSGGSGGGVARSLGLGLLAVAAITATVLVGRIRLEDRAGDDGVPNGGETAPPGIQLDQIRSAGL